MEAIFFAGAVFNALIAVGNAVKGNVFGLLVGALATALFVYLALATH